jgi:O-acetyl-ADP-ribose deacetylase (regulator of RNase III)
VQYLNGRVRIVQGDITRLPVDAIVNAANKSLLGGGGVDGAIHRVAGPELLVECRTLGGANTGEAKTTKGYNLPSQWIIHTVGPIWNGGDCDEDNLLADCYWNSLEEAEKKGGLSVAFPAVSTGVYRFPLERATRIAIGVVRDFLGDSPSSVEQVVFCCFSAKAQGVYESVADELLSD